MRNTKNGTIIKTFKGHANNSIITSMSINNCKYTNSDSLINDNIINNTTPNTNDVDDEIEI